MKVARRHGLLRVGMQDTVQRAPRGFSTTKYHRPGKQKGTAFFLKNLRACERHWFERIGGVHYGNVVLRHALVRAHADNNPVCY